jgi:regulator of protease activity HflC (stomatin/prohibitin superfamily)
MKLLLLEAINPGVFVPVVILLVAAIIAVSCIRVVPQTQSYIIERLGKYYKTWGTGVHWLVPFIDHIALDVSAPAFSSSKLDSPRRIGIVNLKEQVIDFDPQPVITKDNVTMQIDTVIYFQITDPKLYVYGVSNPLRALDNLTTTTIRNIMGGMELDVALTSRNVINETMRKDLDEATDPWGIKVKRVEIKNIMPPKDIREAMEKQMRAEREKRAAILTAEGQKESAIRQAEGEKESAILRAEAKKEASIKEAEGQAQAILKINQAQAEGLKLIKEVQLDKGVLTLKAYEALEKVADGKATKIIIPSELQGLAGLALSAKEIVSTQDAEVINMNTAETTKATKNK